MPPATRRIELSPRARADLLAIATYTLNHWGPAQLDGYMRDLHRTIATIAANPGRGIDRAALKPGLRSIMHLTHYHIFYRVAEDAVQIVRVLHTRQRLESGLDEA